MKHLYLFIAFLLPVAIFAQEGSTSLIAEPGQKKVITTGYGETAEQALDNALRNAVEQATGALISSTTKTENDDIVEDKVLSLSRGFIKDYRKLSETKQDGEYKTVVAALITEKQIIETLEAQGMKVEYNTASVFEQYQAWDKMKADELELAKSLFDLHNFENHSTVYEYKIVMDGPKRQGDNYRVGGTLKGRFNKNYQIEFQNLKNILSELAMEAIEMDFKLPLSYNVAAGSSQTVTYNRYMFKTYYKNKKGKIKSDSKSVDMILPQVEQRIISKRNALGNRAGARMKFVGNQEANMLYGLGFKKYKKVLSQEDKNRLNNYRYDNVELVYDFFEKDFSPYLFVIMEGSSYLTDAKKITFYKFMNKETVDVIKNYMAEIFENIHCKVVFEMDGSENVEYIPDAYYGQIFSMGSELWSDKAQILYEGYIFFKREDLIFNIPVEKVFPADEFRKIKQVNVEPYFELKK